MNIVKRFASAFSTPLIAVTVIGGAALGIAGCGGGGANTPSGGGTTGNPAGLPINQRLGTQSWNYYGNFDNDTGIVAPVLNAAQALAGNGGAFRTDVHWDDIMDGNGNINDGTNGRPNYFQRYVNMDAAIRARGMHPVWVAQTAHLAGSAFGSTNITTFPQTAAQRALYAQFYAYLCQNLPNNPDISIGNEPNLHNGNNPAQVTGYGDLVIAVGQAKQQASITIGRILAPEITTYADPNVAGTAQQDFTYATDFARLFATYRDANGNSPLDYVNVYTIHGYTSNSKETPEQYIPTINTITSYAGGKPVWMTEQGWTTDQVSGFGVTETQQLQLMLRGFFCSMIENIDQDISYEALDQDGPNWLDNNPGPPLTTTERKFGFLRSDFSHKPVYDAFASLLVPNNLGTYRYGGYSKPDANNPNHYRMLLVSGTPGLENVTVQWTAGTDTNNPLFPQTPVFGDMQNGQFVPYQAQPFAKGFDLRTSQRSNVRAVVGGKTIAHLRFDHP